MQIEIHFTGLAEDRAGRGVFWLEFESKFQGLACGVVKLGPGTALLQRRWL